MSSVPCYTLILEEDYIEALKDGETIQSLAYSEYSFLEESCFSMYSDYVSSIEYNEDEKKRVEAAKDIAMYLGDFAKVDEHGVIEISADGKIKLAAQKLEIMKKTVSDMTPEEYLYLGEYELRKVIQDTDMLVFPAVYEKNTEIGVYIQTLDAFIYNLPKTNKPLRFVPIQTAWLHQ